MQSEWLKIYFTFPMPLDLSEERDRRSFRESVDDVIHNLDRVPGFVEFHLLKGPEAEDHTL
jgi:heme-degrading monooxygenase HmoA